MLRRARVPAVVSLWLLMGGCASEPLGTKGLPAGPTGRSAPSAQAEPSGLEITESGPSIVSVPVPAASIAVDRFGDPLPPGAVARFGSDRLHHGGVVGGVARLGDSLVSAGDGLGHRGSTLRFWDAKTYRLSAAADVDGVHAIAASESKPVMVALTFSDAFVVEPRSDGYSTRRLPAREDALVAAAITRDGALAAILRGGGCDIDLYEIGRGGDREDGAARIRAKATLGCPAEQPKGLAVSDDGALVAVSDARGSLFVIDVTTRKIAFAHAPGKAQRAAPVLAFVPRSRDLIEARADGTLARFEPRERRAVYEIERAFEGEAASMAISESARDIAVGSTAGRADVTLFEALDGKKHWEAENPGWAAFGYAVAFDGPDRLVVGTGTGSIEIYEVRTGKRMHPLEGSEEGVNALAFLDEDQVLANGGYLDLWSVAAPHSPPRHPVAGETPDEFVLSDARDTLLVRRGDVLEKLAVPGFRKLGELVDLDGGLRGASPDVRVVFLSDFGSFQRVDTRAMKRLGALPGVTATRTADCVAVARDGSRVAAVLQRAGSGGRLHRWESPSASPKVEDPFDPNEDVLDCAFTPGGVLVIGTSQGLYVASRRGGAKKILDDRYLWRIEPDPKRERVAFSDTSFAVALLDVATGAVREVGSHADDVRALAFSPSGERLASGSDDDSVIVWDVR